MKHLLQTNAGRKCYCSTPTYCLDGADALQDVLVQGRSGGRGREISLQGLGHMLPVVENVHGNTRQHTAYMSQNA